MASKISTPESVFEKVLVAFETGGFTYADVLEQLRRLLATGASPTQLLEVLQHRELAEPLPAYAHREVLGLLSDAIAHDEAISREAALRADEETALSQISEPVPVDAEFSSIGAADEEVSIDWGDLDHFEDEPDWPEEDAGDRSAEASGSSRASTLNVLSEFVRPPGADMSMLAERVRTLEDKIDQQVADCEALARANERSKSAESAAVTRSAALAAELTAARAALESEQRKTQSELRTLHDSLSARDAAVIQVRRSLDERDAQLAALQKEHARIVPALEARAVSAAQLEIDLQSARAHAMESADAAIVQVRHSLEEREAQLAALQQEHARIVPALEARARVITVDLIAARAHADALSLELKVAQKAAAALHAQLRRNESQLNSARTELGAANAQSSSYLEQLRTHDWRRGFDQNLYRDMDPWAVTADVAPAARSASDDAQPAIRESAPPAPAAQRQTPPSASARDGAWKRASVVRAAGAAAALLVVSGLAWVIAHRAPPPRPPPVQAMVRPPGPRPGTLIQDCATCPAVTVLPTGRFEQGSGPAEGGNASFDKPLHWVIIGHAFAMSTNAVTVDEFQEFIAATGRDMQGCDTYDGQWKHRPKSSWQSPGFAQTGAHPVTCVSWNDAKAYASWLSAKTGSGYRLPSASEWEYSARAGNAAALPWNPDGTGACANANVADASAARRYPGWTVFACDDGYVYTSPVGSFKANLFGLNDMLGNVFQWTEDCWHPDYRGAPVDGSARADGDCTEHELRGGSWFSIPGYVRANYRNHFAADYRTSSVGIRLVRDLGQ